MDMPIPVACHVRDAFGGCDMEMPPSRLNLETFSRRRRLGPRRPFWSTQKLISLFRRQVSQGEQNILGGAWAGTECCFGETGWRASKKWQAKRGPADGVAAAGSDVNDRSAGFGLHRHECNPPLLCLRKPGSNTHIPTYHNFDAPLC